MLRLVPSFLLGLALAAPCAALLERAAVAQEVGADLSSDARAYSLFQQGKTLYSQGKAADAAAQFRAAWDIKHSFDVAGNLGTVEIELGRYRDGAEHLAYAIAHFPVGIAPEVRKRLDAELAKAMTHVGEVVVSCPAEAEIAIDGKPIGVAPLALRVFLDPGDYVMQGKRAGALTTRQLHITAGATAQATLDFGGPGVPPVLPTTGGGPKPVVLIAGGSLAIVGVALGFVFMAVSNGKSTDAHTLLPSATASRCPVEDGAATGTCATLVNDLGGKTTFANASVAAFIAGGAFGVATAAYAVFAPRSKPDSSAAATVAPFFSPTAAGLGLRGSF